MLVSIMSNGCKLEACIRCLYHLLSISFYAKAAKKGEPFCRFCIFVCHRLMISYFSSSLVYPSGRRRQL